MDSVVGIVTTGLNEPGLEPREEQEMFSSTKLSRLVLRPTQSSTQ